MDKYSIAKYVSWQTVIFNESGSLHIFKSSSKPVNTDQLSYKSFGGYLVFGMIKKWFVWK